MSFSEEESLLILSHIRGLGICRIESLLTTFGSAKNCLSRSKQELLAISGFGEKGADNLLNWKDNPFWQEDLELVKKYHVHLIHQKSPLYPRPLFDLKDPPLLLYALGDFNILQTKGISIIGSRQPTIYGQEVTHQFAEHFSQFTVTIISGMARGIDTIAHKASIESGGKTIAVIGSGLANIYPKENKELARNIIKNGVILSEYPMMEPPHRRNFPKRNRIVAALSEASIVMEAKKKSGALITMEQARSLQRKTFAIPGRIDSANFEGNHNLIKNHLAQLVSHPQEIADFLQLEYKDSVNIQAGVPLSQEERGFLDLFPGQEVCIDDIIRKSPFPIQKVNTLLISLTLKKRLRQYPGKVYKRV